MTPRPDGRPGAARARWGRPWPAAGVLALALAACGRRPAGDGAGSAAGGPSTPAPTIPPRVDGLALEAFVGRLRDADAASRRDALEALSTRADVAASHGAEIAPLLDDPDVRVRAAALELVGRIGLEVPDGVAPAAPGLVRRLADPDPAVRRQAARAVASLPACAPALAAGMAAEAASDRAPVKAALVTMGPAAAPAVDALARLLTPDDPGRAEDVAEVLGRLGAAGVPPLVRALGHEDGYVVVLAATALGAAGEAGAVAVPSLERVAASRRGDPRAAALDALGRLRAAGVAGAAAALDRLAASADAPLAEAAAAVRDAPR